jgi:hypothetical protein
MFHRRIALLAITSLLTVGAQAQTTSNAPLTREQVRAEYLQALRQGQLPATGEVGYVPQVGPAISIVSRRDVLRELAATGPQNTAEGSDLGKGRAALSVRSRPEVHAEAVNAVRNRVRIGGEP